MPTNGPADYAWSPASQSDRGARGGLPNNTEAEANVLAAMMLSNEVVEEALVELLPDDFYRPSHKTIFTAMHGMYESNTPIDTISLIDYLTSIDKLEAVGGEAYILELMGNTMSLVNWQHHASIVRRDAMLREATARAQKREEEIVGEARAEAASIRAAAEADIAQERKKAVNDLKNEIGGMAVEIAGKVVEREINESDHQALIDEFIRNVGDAS